MAVILKRQRYYLGCEGNPKTSDTTDTEKNLTWTRELASITDGEKLRVD